MYTGSQLSTRIVGYHLGTIGQTARDPTYHQLNCVPHYKTIMTHLNPESASVSMITYILKEKTLWKISKAFSPIPFDLVVVLIGHCGPILRAYIVSATSLHEYTILM